MRDQLSNWIYAEANRMHGVQPLWKLVRLEFAVRILERIEFFGGTVPPSSRREPKEQKGDPLS